MFQLDEDIASSNKALQSLAENWEKLTPETRSNILAVFNGDKSDTFYRGALSAYVAAARLMSDKNFPESQKHTVFAGAAGLVASRLAYGEWPPQ